MMKFPNFVALSSLWILGPTLALGEGALNMQKDATVDFLEAFESDSYLSMQHRSGLVRSSDGEVLGNTVRARLELKLGGRYDKKIDFFVLGGLERAPGTDYIGQFRPEFEIGRSFFGNPASLRPFVKGKLPFAADGSRGTMGVSLFREESWATGLPATIKLFASWSEGLTWSSRRTPATVENDTGTSASEYGLTDIPGTDQVGGTDIENGQGFESEVFARIRVIPGISSLWDAEISTRATVDHGPKYSLQESGKVYRAYQRSEKIKSVVRANYGLSPVHKAFGACEIYQSGLFQRPISADDRSGEPFLKTIVGVTSLF